MNYLFRKAYIEMMYKENKQCISEDIPSGAMGSGSYMKASLDTPSDSNAIYVAYKKGKCKQFKCPITRRSFMDENKGWTLAETIEVELTFEEKLIWEELGALYLDEDGNELDDDTVESVISDDILVEEEDIEERIIKSWIKSKDKKILRVVSDRKGFKIVKDKKSGLSREVKLTPQEKNKRVVAAKRAKKYYKKNRKKKLKYMKNKK